MREAVQASTPLPVRTTGEDVCASSCKSLRARARVSLVSLAWSKRGHAHNPRCVARTLSALACALRLSDVAALTSCAPPPDAAAAAAAACAAAAEPALIWRLRCSWWDSSTDIGSAGCMADGICKCWSSPGGATMSGRSDRPASSRVTAASQRAEVCQHASTAR